MRRRELFGAHLFRNYFLQFVVGGFGFLGEFCWVDWVLFVGVLGCVVEAAIGVEFVGFVVGPGGLAVVS